MPKLSKAANWSKNPDHYCPRILEHLPDRQVGTSCSLLYGTFSIQGRIGLAQKVKTEARYRGIGIGVVTLALLGWLLALYFWSSAAELRDELEYNISLSGSAADIETRVVALQTEAAQVEVSRDQGLAELDQLEHRLAEARDETASSEAQAQALRAELEALVAEVGQSRDEQASLQQDLEQARTEIRDTSQEFADVGERLEQARLREANLLTWVSDLTADVAQLTEEASGAEMRVQTAREAEASLEQEVLAAREELAMIEAMRGTAEDAVTALVQRQTELVTDTVAAEEQLQTIQGVIGELSESLAERSEYLTDLQSRIADLQQETAQPSDSAAMGLILGQLYAHGPVTAIFDPAGRFQMANDRTGEAAAGTYILTDGFITLSQVDGDLRDAEFPMRCGLVSEADGFRLRDEDGSCALLSEILFDRVDP